MIDFTGLDWWTHDRLVNYNMPNPAEPDISNWLIQNPQRLNIANIGLYFFGDQVTEDNLVSKSQYLDLWEGTIVSNFRYNGSNVSVQVWCHPLRHVIGIEIKSDLISAGDLGIFVDFPYSDTNKFDAPYVGTWNDTSHSEVIKTSTRNTTTFKHQIDSNINQVSAAWNTDAKFSAPLEGTNKFTLKSMGSNVLQFVADFSPIDNAPRKLPEYKTIATASKKWWKSYWKSGAFIDLSATKEKNAKELQRRIILSQYLVAVNEASYNPPQGVFNLEEGFVALDTLKYLDKRSLTHLGCRIW